MFYEYKVTYIPEWDHEKPFSEERGLVYAESYREAADKVSDVFKDLLVDMYLCEWDCHKLISLEEIKQGFKLT